MTVAASEWRIMQWCTFIYMLCILGGAVYAIPPVAFDDAYDTWPVTPLKIELPGVLASDYDAETNALTAYIINTTSNGALNFYSDGSFVYTPYSGGVYGPDTFSYVAVDFAETSSVAYVNITVHPPELSKTIMILVYGSGYDTNTLLTVAEMESLMEGVNSNLMEYSYNMGGIQGVLDSNKAADIVGWYENYTPVCFSPDFMDFADAEIDYLQYDTLIMISAPTSGCSEPAMGWLPVSINTPDGSHRMGRVEMVAEMVCLHSLTHEILHALVTRTHADFNDCGSNVLSATGCTGIEYGNPFCIMGDRSLGHLIPAYKEKAGWFNTLNSVISVTNSGQYTLTPYESNSGDPKVLKVQWDDYSYLYITYRQPIGLDASFNPAGAVFEGALFDSGSCLLNMHPPSVYTNAKPQQHEMQYTLKRGETFISPGTGNSLTVVTNDSSGLVMDIVMSGVEFDPPVVSWLSPENDAVITGGVTISVNAVDVSGIDRAEYFYHAASGDIIPLGTTTVASISNVYELVFDTVTNIPNGPGSFSVDVYDIYTNMAGSDQRYIAVANATDTNPPVIQIDYPVQNYTNLTDSISIAASASDDKRLWKVEVYLDGNLKTPAGYKISDSGTYAIYLSSLTRGRRTVTARAYDFEDNYGESTTVVFYVMDGVDETRPWGCFAAPEEGAVVYGTIDLEVMAGDNEGIASVVFILGGNGFHTNTTPPYICSIDTMFIEAGNQTFQAQITDTSDNSAAPWLSRMLTVNQDVDGDGMPSVWEEAYFGGPTNAEAGVDSDGDTQDNLSECIAGTIPTNINSRFVLECPGYDSGAEANIFSWQGVAARVYGVHYSTDLVNSAFAELATNIEAAVDGSVIFTDAVYSAEAQMYYKISVERQ